MKKVILGLVALIALMAIDNQAGTHELAVFNGIKAPVQVSVTYGVGCDHWTETIDINQQEIWHTAGEHCGWKKFEATVQLPSGAVPVDGLDFSRIKEVKDDTVVVLFGPYKGKYYARRVKMTDSGDW